MKKLIIPFILLLTQYISASNYIVTLEDKHYKGAISVESIIKYDEEGYNQNGNNIDGFNRSHINETTGTQYDEDGFDYLGLGVKIVEYSRANTEVSYCKGCSRVKYTVKYHGAIIAYSYTFNVIKNGKLLTRGPSRDCSGGQYSTCRLGINTQLIKPTE